MENKLKTLFEYQKFEQNRRLEKLIAETEARSATELSDDELELVSAAGELPVPSDSGGHAPWHKISGTDRIDEEIADSFSPKE